MNYDKLTKEQLLGIHKDTLEYLNEQEQEIERLNNIIKKAIKWFDNADRRGLNELLNILKGVDK